MTVLHVVPITSPLLAVRAAIVQEFRENDRNRSLRKPDGHRSQRVSAKAGTLRVRVTTGRITAIERIAKSKKQTVSEWIRSTLNAAM